MRRRQLFLGLTIAFSALVSSVCCHNVTSGETRTEVNGSAFKFGSFRKQFHRLYEIGSEESDRRHRYFQDATKRHAYLNSFSAAPQSARYGINQFSDLSQEEFRDLYLQAQTSRAPCFSGPKTVGLPAKFDWRQKAVVAPVQNQQACGSCWAFSVVGAMQSVHAIEGSKLEQLSVQQVLDCSYKNKGCSGGSPLWALDWLKQTGVKLVPQSEYPYKAKTGICHFFSQSHGGVAVTNFTAHDFSGQEEAMMGQLVERGPLTAIVDAVSWQDYLGGIIQHHCSSQWSNHAILVVGYDTTGDIPYWIVQNSWGTTWGNEGYVYIKIGGNVCGIADSVAAVFL
ncbi:cathepsin O [Mastacembelus armatus]|uniref:Cathepsin O n=1 Tax=Mastacembelus armatus TaxID=205130 RepID=A0A3Q3MDT3_9TELE|nr:cathepsin O [Mastacembelus armatus]XP_033181286.1 cathepsin O [Mastacembelus armatus]XP_033181287.1 cathepsin O [Mastacembelus armatus]XP_033181288.1 cathepsin O [Mastacembelus armatus]